MNNMSKVQNVHLLQHQHTNKISMENLKTRLKRYVHILYYIIIIIIMLSLKNVTVAIISKIQQTLHCHEKEKGEYVPGSRFNYPIQSLKAALII